MNATFNAIPSGIFKRLAKLTSRTKTNAQTRIEKISRTCQGVNQIRPSSKDISDSKINLDESGRFKTE